MGGELFCQIPLHKGGGNGLALSIKLEELQTLINEVRQLRQENINFFNELAKHHWILNNNIGGGDFGVYVSNRIHINSADFVAKNMIATARFFDRDNHLKHALRQVELDGLFMEFGVFQGASINLIATEKPEKIIYGFDSFEGLPEDWTAGAPKGTFDAKGELPQVNENVRLIKGWFDKTLPDFVKQHNENCAFIHVDCDLYSSAKTIFSVLKDRIVSDTVIVFDEYINYLGWEQGEHKAFTEFLRESNLSCDYISYSNMQIAVKIKC